MRRGLVIDDSRVIRKVACRLLKEFDISADEAEDAESALAACRLSMPDLILLDGDAPGLNSSDFVRTLRKGHGGEKPRVLYCVTEIDVAHIGQVLHAGANHYILKPFDRIAMRQRLADLDLA